MQKLLNEQEAAEILNLAPKTLRNWRCQGYGPAYLKIGRLVRYKWEDLQSFAGAVRIEVGELSFRGYRTGQRRSVH